MEWILTYIDFLVHICKTSLFPWLLNWGYCQLLKRKVEYYVHCSWVALFLDKVTSSAVWCFVHGGINVIPEGNGNELNFTSTKETAGQSCTLVFICNQMLYHHKSCLSSSLNKLELLVQVVTPHFNNELQDWWLLKKMQKAKQRTRH